MSIEEYSMNVTKYKKFREEERILRKEYKETTDEIAGELYQEFETKWLDFLLDIFDLLREEGKDASFECNEFTFTFDLSWRIIRVYKTKKMKLFYINSMLEIKQKEGKWIVLRDNHFDPESDYFEEWQKDVEDLLEKTPGTQFYIKQILDKKAEQAIKKTNKIIENIKKRISRIKEERKQRRENEDFLYHNKLDRNEE